MNDAADTVPERPEEKPTATPSAAAVRSARADLAALTKAKLSALVVVTTFAGYWLGSAGSRDLWVLLHTIFGTTLCAFGSAVFNQLIEIDIDARMQRTADRPLPARRIPTVGAFALGTVLCGFGLIHLAAKSNVEASALAAATLFTYLFLYTPLKQRSTTNTLVGAVSGALPPVIGWAAAAGPSTADVAFRWQWLVRPEAWFLFALLFFWQLPHFLAINWMYRDEYRRAGFVMWSNTDETGRKTATLSLLFSLCLIGVALMPLWGRFLSWPALVAGVLLALWLIALSLRFLRSRQRTDARKLFFATLLYLPLMLVFVLAFAR